MKELINQKLQEKPIIQRQPLCLKRKNSKVGKAFRSSLKTLTNKIDLERLVIRKMGLVMYSIDQYQFILNPLKLISFILNTNLQKLTQSPLKSFSLLDKLLYSQFCAILLIQCKKRLSN